MTKEQLQAIVEDQVKSAVTAQGRLITEGMADTIKNVVTDVLKEKVDVKSIITPDDEFKQRTEDPKAGFKFFSEFAMAVKSAEVSKGRNIDKRLDALEIKSAGDGLIERDAEYGGYLIPEEFRNQLLEVAIGRSNIMALAMAIPMATNVVNIPYIAGLDRSSGTLHGGIQFKWLDEAGQKTETKPEFGKIQLRLKKCAGLAYATDEILEDSPVSLEAILTRMFSDALAWQMDNVFINGSGAGKPIGVLNAPCLVSVAKETEQSADTILYENIINMYSRMWNKTDAIWMANDDTFRQLAAMSLAVGTSGSPVWLPAGGVSGKPYDTLMGKPLVFTEHCQTLGDKGDILFADWTQYLVGQRAGAGAGMKFASSIHLKFDYDQVAFRFVFRIDGQPWWPSALKGRYSAVTLSPFVTLDERA